MLPDMWARGQDQSPGSAPAVDHGGPVADRGESRSSARRPLAVLAAVLLLTAGGLGASFLAKGSSSSHAVAAASNGGAPTILAATGPTKIKADDGSTTAPEDQDAALLNKNGSMSSGPVKIVSSQEQPADLGQLPKSDLADGARPLPQPSPSPFPEPKKVKTFLVHPDGTMLSGDPAPSGTASSPVAPSPAPLPATPKTASRGGATPAASLAVPSIASLSADPSPTDSTPAAPPPAKPARQAAAPGVKTASAKPTDTADAPASGGGYGVQLASSPNEADANAAFAKLKKKYPSQLGAYTATVHKAETGDKPVYRVRIGGMSQDEAKTLCSQLQTAGGSCFVMHN
jgi:cell division septation protein DedD